MSDFTPEVEARLQWAAGESHSRYCSDITSALSELKRQAEELDARAKRIAELEDCLLNVIGGQQDPNIRAEDLATLACKHTLDTHQIIAALNAKVSLCEATLSFDRGRESPGVVRSWEAFDMNTRVCWYCHGTGKQNFAGCQNAMCAVCFGKKTVPCLPTHFESHVTSPDPDGMGNSKPISP